jgi:glycine/D-amino acid oxidase-like deaminating enzyme
VSDEEFFRGSRGRLTGLHYAESGYIDLPSLAAQNLVGAACRLGAGFVRRAQVVGIKTARSGVDGVRLADGTEISTPIAVNAAGPWSDRLNVVAGVAEEMVVRGRPLRTETHEIPAPAEFGNGVFVTDLDLGSAFRPQGASRVHISSIEPECDALEWLEAPDDCDRRPSDVIFQRQVLRVARRMPKLVVPNRPVGLGAVYDVTPDWTPIIDRTSLSGLYLACGTSGNSFKIAPFIGRALDALIVASESGQDHDRSPVQMPGRHLPVEFDLGAYSRLRRITSSRPRNVLG